MRFTLEQLAHVLGREPSEAPGPVITGVRPVEFAQSTDITYVSDVRYLDALFKGSACAVVAPSEFDVRGMPCIRSDNPEADFARLTALFWAYESPPPGISPKSEIHPEAHIARGASIGAFTVIGRGATVGDRAMIGPHVVIGEDVEVGEDSRLFPHVTVYGRVKIGKRVIIHSGTVIGSDGFGYARDVDSHGAPVAIKKYHSGSVEIEDDVEIGALCAIDRALAGVTRIGSGVKVDNLVQIAHNVQIGSGSVIASQVGIAGSSSMGKYCLVGGQVGVKDHVSVGNGVVLATRVGIYRNVPDGSVMAGSVPAMPHKIFLRAQSLFKRLPEIFERVRKLERLAEVNRKEEV